MPTEFFQHLEIFERDGWICQLCGEPVDPQVRYPDNFSATIDHVVPLARRGAHTRENVQLAHMLCNATKKDQVA